jgi:hypothetical protein
MIPGVGLGWWKCVVDERTSTTAVIAVAERVGGIGGWMVTRCRSPHLLLCDTQLGNTEEYIDGALAGNLGEVLIRCNNVLYIRSAEEVGGVIVACWRLAASLYAPLYARQRPECETTFLRV